MSNVRTDPLTPEEIAEYNERGFLLPIRVLDDEQVETAREALEEHLAGGRESKTYELTDPIIESDKGKATVGADAAMMVAEGSHKLGEKLPVEFGDGSSFMHDERPGVGEVTTPEEAGLEAVGYELKAGECGFHHALLWHASGPNTSPNPRRGFI